MNILFTGGTGLIGQAFINKFRKEHSFTVVSRNTAKAAKILGNDLSYAASIAEINDIGVFDAVINLAGEPIADKRWTDTQKKVICDSRWETTSQLAAKITSSNNPPKVFISGSAIGYYGDQGDFIVDEDTPPKKEFTHELCSKWENIAETASSESTRLILLRTGVVLSPSGGALDKMAMPFKLGVGGTLGTGEQYLAWIHIDDMVDAIAYLLHSESSSGAFNLTAPNPVTNKVFSKQLASSLNRPCLFNVPSFVMKIAMGESSEMILKGQRVIPKKLSEAGYTFTFPTVDKALKNIYSR